MSLRSTVSLQFRIVCLGIGLPILCAIVLVWSLASDARSQAQSASLNHARGIGVTAEAAMEQTLVEPDQSKADSVETQQQTDGRAAARSKALRLGLSIANQTAEKRGGRVYVINETVESLGDGPTGTALRDILVKENQKHTSSTPPTKRSTIFAPCQSQRSRLNPLFPAVKKMAGAPTAPATRIFKPSDQNNWRQVKPQAPLRPFL